MTTVVVVAAILAGLVLAGLAIYLLLARITSWGGDRPNAMNVRDNFIAEANAFRGSSSADDPTWDGTNRIAPPTQDGGVG